MNQVTIVGNLTADPELRYTGTGVPGRQLLGRGCRTASTPPGRRRIGPAASSAATRGGLRPRTPPTLSKGTRAIVVGEFVQRKLEDSGGNKRSTIEIQVNHVGPDLQWVSAEVGPSAATPADEKQPA
jgi:single-strand DNA-binding protein